MVELEKLMMRATEEVVIAADHTKFGSKSLAKFCDLEAINHLVSDVGLAPPWVDMLQAAGVDVRLSAAPEKA